MKSSTNVLITNYFIKIFFHKCYFFNEKSVLNIDSTESKINKIVDKSQNLKILPIFKNDEELQQETWDYGSLKSNVNYFYPPRFLIVEVIFFKSKFL